MLPRATSEVALRTEEGDAVLTLGRAGWGSVVFLAVNPFEMSAAVLQVASVAGTAAGAADSEAYLTVEADRVRIEIAAQDRLPDVRVRRPGGAVESVEMYWNAPGRARGLFAVAGVGEYLLDLDGVQRRFWFSAREGQAPAVRESRRIERAATPARVRRTVRRLAPFLLALAALIFLVDSALGLRPARGSFTHPGRS